MDEMKTIKTRLDQIELYEGELFMMSRRRRGVSQLELERRTGVRQVAISRWENGAMMPDEVVEILWAAIAEDDLRAPSKFSAMSVDAAMLPAQAVTAA